MSYRIVYGPMPKNPNVKSKEKLRLQTLTVVFLLLFILLVRQTWPEGRETLRRVLIPGEMNVTEEAFYGMIGEIRAGEPVGEAVTAFCRQIVEYGIRESS